MRYQTAPRPVAGDGSRTRTKSLEGSCAAVTPRPRCSSSLKGLSLILLDLDYFKKINDTFGHERGNEALAVVGIFLRSEIRTSDVAARMGGEEFAVLLPDTSREGALQLAEKLRRGLHAVKVTGLQQPLTASFGVATFPDDAVDGDVLMRISDRALYAAKQAGRDRVEAPSGVPRVRPEASASDSLPASS
jgi:diguanylate cyclase (GGDEF)-like protein